KYLFYTLQSAKAQIYFKNSVTGGTIKNLGLKALREFQIQIPPLEEQERIVEILDRFDKLCNDLSEGLPAEIDARQKQYEYYRDKLLRF
ncbi:TPA: restriction endonuclease subunit S, partial [Candidatus Scatousia excrementigallinarum]|nr:restriction endonuclease subunit S [Candidatus Scatousia excrementigallinarum]